MGAVLATRRAVTNSFTCWIFYSSFTSTSPSETIIDMLWGFQSSVKTQFQQLSTHLGRIDEWMDEMELQQKAMQEKLQKSSLLSSSSVSTPSSSSSGTSGRRSGRVTPTALQVRSPLFYDKLSSFYLQSKIRLVHASFHEEKQLNSSELYFVTWLLHVTS